MLIISDISNTEYKDAKIDDASIVMIYLLIIQGGEERVSALRDKMPVKHSGSVHHRVRDHLSPAGLVVRDRKIPINSGSNEESIYRITDEGRQWANANWEMILNTVSAATVHESFSTIESKMQEWSAEMDSMRERFDQVEQSNRNQNSKISYWKAKVQDTEEEYKRAAKMESVEWLADRLVDSESRF